MLAYNQASICSRWRWRMQIFKHFCVGFTFQTLKFNPYLYEVGKWHERVVKLCLKAQQNLKDLHQLHHSSCKLDGQFNEDLSRKQNCNYSFYHIQTCTDTTGHTNTHTITSSHLSPLTSLLFSHAFTNILSLPQTYFPPNHTHFPPFPLLPLLVTPCHISFISFSRPPKRCEFASAGQRGGWRKKGRVWINRLFTLTCGGARNQWQWEIKL